MIEQYIEEDGTEVDSRVIAVSESSIWMRSVCGTLAYSFLILAGYLNVSFVPLVIPSPATVHIRCPVESVVDPPSLSEV
jgi:hypothetical protein